MQDQELPIKALTTTQKLYGAVFGEKYPEYDIEQTDLPQLLEILQLLCEQEEQVIKWHFGLGSDCLTYKEIAAMWNTDAAFVKSIAAKAIRRLRHPKLAELMKLLFTARAECREQIPSPVPILDWTIADLDLPVRIYNCLRWAGLIRVRDIVLFCDHNPEKLLTIRHLGGHSQEKILTKLKDLGVSID
jgi:hypothetical protein